MKKQTIKSAWLALPLLLTMVSVQTAQAQPLIGNPENLNLRSGNKLYQSGNFTGAEIDYRTALENNPKSYRANFGIGDAMYQQKQYDLAAKQFQLAAEQAKTLPEKSAAFHNLGNSLLQKQDYAQAAEAFKQALKLNPGDADSRYNLAYAQKKLQQNQQQQQQQNQNQDQDKKDDQQKQDQQQQDKQDKQNQDKESNPEENPEGQQKDQQPSKPRMSQEEIDRMLKALQFQEEQLQKDLQKRKVQPKTPGVKDW